jgi:protein involved in polysaccharide export with SLBB domain
MNLTPLSRSNAARTLVHWGRRSVCLIGLTAGLAGMAMAADPGDSRSTTTSTSTSTGNADGGPVRLTAPGRERERDAQRERERGRERDDGRQRRDELELDPLRRSLPMQPPSEFETYVQSLLPLEHPPIQRFGIDLIAGDKLPRADAETVAEVPADYVVGVGDELHIAIWGSVDADLRLTVDRTGRISIPRVGPVLVAGVRHADLSQVLQQRAAQVFRNFKLSATLGKVRSVRVYVTGFAVRPGAYTVSALSTLVNAVMLSGGPSAAGSMRRIELRRVGKPPVAFDLYDLLVRGDKSADRSLQAEDVVHFTAVGEQVAMIGSVNQPAIFELKPGETVSDLLAMAGGFAAVGERSRVLIERLTERNDVRVVELRLPVQGQDKPRAGDVVRAVSAITVAQPQNKRNKRVRIEGEVQRPGEYLLPPGTTLADAVKAAGGLTPGAYLFGTELNRDSVRLQQEQNYDRALRDLETEFTRKASTQKATTSDEAAAQTAQAANSTRLIERLRTVRPTGRIVLQMSPNASSLPDVALEDGDRLLIPSRPNTVGVFGSVFNGGSFLYGEGRTVRDFLQLAGGSTRGADTASIFVLRANGSVLSARQESGWILSGNGLDASSALPGDTIFVPEELNKTTITQAAREWTQIFYQFGLGAAGLKVLKD